MCIYLYLIIHLITHYLFCYIYEKIYLIYYTLHIIYVIYKKRFIIRNWFIQLWRFRSRTISGYQAGDPGEPMV